MDLTHDFEARNAREWDDISQVSESFPPGFEGKTSEVPPITLTKPTVAAHESTYTGTILSLQPQSLTSRIRQEKDGSRLKASNTPRGWAKGPQLVTTARAESQRVDEEIAAQRNIFRNNPIHSNFITTSYYFWPETDTSPMEILGNNLKDVDHIREVYKTYIDWDPSMQSLRLRSPTGQNVKEVVEALKAAIQAARVKAAGCTQYYVVQPPSAASMTDRVSPVFSMVTSLNQQPLVESVVLTGQHLSAQRQREWGKQRDAIADRQKYQCFERTHDALSKLRSLRTPMKLRVHFGTICISVYRKEFRSPGFDYDALCSMMGEGRTKATLNKNIRLPLNGTKITEKINNSIGIFCPANSLAKSSLRDIEPKHGLVILARTPTGEQLRLEADIDKVQEGGVGLFQIGTVNYYLHDTSIPRLTVAVMNLEGCPDWALEIVTNMQISEQPPKALQNLVRGCITRFTAERVGNDGEPYPAITLQVPPGIIIDAVVVRTIRQFRLQHTNLLAEVTIYRNWSTEEMAGDPSIACGITLYNSDWDRTLTPSDESSRIPAFSDDLHELFPASDGSQSGFSEFWASISRIQEFLSKA